MTEKDRLIKLMEAEKLNSTQFAEKIGVQRATLSHILSGRNAPSLNVLQKTLQVFRTINTDWLILGVGSMYRTSTTQQPTLFDVQPTVDEKKTEVTAANECVARIESTSSVGSLPTNKGEILVEKMVEKHIEKIVVFYSNNTYEEIVR